jgi:hypothetical protein
MINPPVSRTFSRARAATVAAAGALLFLTAAPTNAQIVERRPRERPALDTDLPRTPSTWVGGSLTYADPRGDFANYVNGAFGITGNLIHSFGDDGVVSLRADLGYLIYGHTTRRQALGGGALGLINVDVTTSNNILNGGIGLQLMTPDAAIRPYVNGTIGFSYFFTQSTIEGSESFDSPFAESENYSDGGFTTAFGGGVYIPLSRGAKRVSLDLGVQYHKNSDIKYLTKESIYIQDTQSTPVITPVRSAADFLTFRLGLSFGLPFKN